MIDRILFSRIVKILNMSFIESWLISTKFMVMVVRYGREGFKILIFKVEDLKSEFAVWISVRFGVRVSFIGYA